MQDLSLLLNFFDPASTSNGQPYAIARFKQIVHERYLISKYLHTPYTDVGAITPAERMYLMQFLLNDFEKEKEARDKAIAKSKQKV